MKLNRPASRTLASTGMSMAPIVLGIAVSLSASTALANPADLFGLGSRQIGMGNAYTAVADTAFAAYYNAGGLSQIDRVTISFGMQYGRMRLGDPSACQTVDGIGCSSPFYYSQEGVQTIQQKRYGYDQPAGTHVGVALPLFRRVKLGITAYLPLDVQYDEDGKFAGAGMRLTRFMTIDPYLPDYVLYQNRPQRFAAYFAVSFEPIRGLGIGIGASMLADAAIDIDMKVKVAAVAVEESDGSTSATVDAQINPLMVMDLTPKLSPVAGILWNLGSVNPALQSWQLGATYRGQDSLGTEATVGADMSVALDVGDEEAYSYGGATDPMVMAMYDHFTPQQAAFGISGLFADRLRVSADVTWTNWAAFVPPIASLPDSVPASLGAEITLSTGREVNTSQFQDTFTPRVGFEARIGPFLSDTKLKGVDTFVRLGGGFDQNPFGRQQEYTNLLNSDRVLGGFGVGMKGTNPFRQDRDLPFTVDLAVQYHYLIPTVHTKTISAGSSPPDGFPVSGSYTSQGSVVQGSLTVGVGF